MGPRYTKKRLKRACDNQILKDPLIRKFFGLSSKLAVKQVQCFDKKWLQSMTTAQDTIIIYIWAFCEKGLFHMLPVFEIG